METETPQIMWFENLRNTDVPSVGGKNASLGEMVANLAAQGIKVPRGFAIPAGAYRRFLEENALRATIASALGAFADGKRTLAESSAAIRLVIQGGNWAADTADAVYLAYEALCCEAVRADVDIAVALERTAMSTSA
ncbi:PEP/pyruvate-binding domain-containing protein, partial [Cupriavidus pinatubonensis]|uniref:PEP/pyruvate-binding domain-containing protein n=1 Tax=Cupriavidus pinatubonensis TaxID=248026 RepID=UPI00280BE1FD